MKVITPGHRYELEQSQTTGRPSSAPQVLQFIEKKFNDETPSDLILINEGTTNEDVIAVLIDRLEFLNAKLPDPQNEGAIMFMKEALDALNKRTIKRKQQGIEGTGAASPVLAGDGAPVHPETEINGTDDAGKL